MSSSSLTKLARLSGARSAPPRLLYDECWPGRTRRVLQIAYNLIQWSISGGAALFVTGARLPAGLGRVSVVDKPSLRAIVRGGCVLRGATIGQLAKELKLLPSSPCDVYLADADVLIVMGDSERGPVVAHVTEDDVLIDRHRRGYEQGRLLLQTYGRGDLVPEVIETRKHHAGRILIQRRLAGEVVRASELSAVALAEHLRAAVEILAHFEVASGTGQPLADETLYRASAEALGACPEVFDLAQSAIDALDQWPLRRLRIATLSHGDYWLSNLLFTYEPQLRVSGVLDWERSRQSASVGVDAVHLLMFSYAHWRGCPEPDVLRMIWDDVRDPVLEHLISIVRDELDLSARDIGYIGLQLWIMHLARHANAIGGWSDKKRREWLLGPRKSIDRWLETYSDASAPEELCSAREGSSMRAQEPRS